MSSIYIVIYFVEIEIGEKWGYKGEIQNKHLNYYFNNY